MAGTWKRIESATQRIFGAVVGLIVGAVAGLVAGLFFLESGGFLFVFAGGCLGGLLLGACYPRPFRFLGELLLSLVGIEL